MPDSSWFHRWPDFTQTNYKDQVLFDPYATVSDKKVMSDGWWTSSGSRPAEEKQKPILD
jgi:hypothetical protein